MNDYLLIGYPIKKSLSPFIHRNFYRLRNIERNYSLYEGDRNLKTTIKYIRNNNIQGFNVTLPYKREVIKYLDGLDKSAEVIGSVNTVKLEGGKLIGYNTDGLGFMKSLEKNKVEIRDKTILLLGSGGASYSIVNSLIPIVKKIYIVNRTKENSIRLIEQVAGYNESFGEKLFYVEENLEDIKAEIDLLINTTSIGMDPRLGESPISLEGFGDLAVCDIIYNPLKTSLLQKASKKGYKAINGLEMLLYQGLYSQELWLDTKVLSNEEDYILKMLEEEVKRRG